MSIQSLALNRVQTQQNLQSAVSKIKEDRVDKTQEGQSAANDLAVRGVSVSGAKKLLNDQIITALDKVLTQSNQTSVYELDASDFLPEKVADRILSFVGSALSGLSGDQAAQSEKLQQARAGIEKGFNDAKEILESLSVFNGDIEKNANKTYELLENGLDKMASNIENGLAVLDGLFSNNTDYSSESSISLKQSFAFDLTTSDGDQIRININRLNAGYQSSTLSGNDRELAVTFSESRLTQSDYSMTVEGDLDDDEIAAIDQLLYRMNEIANQYFSGNTQAALEKAKQLGYNTTEIASFSLNLENELTARTQTQVNLAQSNEIGAYQEVNKLAGNSSIQTSVENELAKAKQIIQDYAAQLKNVNDAFVGQSLLSGHSGLSNVNIESIAKHNNDNIGSVASQNDNNSQFTQLLGEIASINQQLFSEDRALNVQSFKELNQEILKS